jgi:hypothetical protein
VALGFNRVYKELVSVAFEAKREEQKKHVAHSIDAMCKVESGHQDRK